MKEYFRRKIVTKLAETFLPDGQRNELDPAVLYPGYQKQYSLKSEHSYHNTADSKQKAASRKSMKVNPIITLLLVNYSGLL